MEIQAIFIQSKKGFVYMTLAQVPKGVDDPDKFKKIFECKVKREAFIPMVKLWAELIARGEI